MVFINNIIIKESNVDSKKRKNEMMLRNQEDLNETQLLKIDNTVREKKPCH